MMDITERLECAAESQYFNMLQADGKLKCYCGKIFHVDEGTIVSANPYAMPVCPDCFTEYKETNRDTKT
jgi:hypothetical protein